MSEASEAPALPAMSNAGISVLLLAQNESAHVEGVLTSWCKQLEQLQREYEVIVIDCGSADRTAELVRSAGQSNSRVKLERFEQAHGDGAALKAGVAAARYPLLFYTTCDRQYQAVDLHLLLAEIDKA